MKFSRVYLIKFTFLISLLVAGVSCKKEKPQAQVPASDFKVAINGAELIIKKTDLEPTYYTTSGDNVSALMTSVRLDNSGGKLVFFISDLKSGNITLTKKSGTALRRVNAPIRLAATESVQSYVQYTSNGNFLYAVSGTITVSIDGQLASIKWNLVFKDSAGKTFTSTGSFVLDDFKINTKSKNEIVDPTPTATDPLIEKISPRIGRTNDVIYIRGVNFSTAPGDNIVKFNGREATVLTSSDTMITVLVPQCRSGFVTLKVKDKEEVKGPAFVFNRMLFTDISTNGHPGDTVFVSGYNLSAEPSDNVVTFSNGKKGTVITAVDYSLMVEVPEGVVSGPVSVQVLGLPVEGSHNFTVSTPYPQIAWEEVFSSTTIQKTNMMASVGNVVLLTGGKDADYLYIKSGASSFVNVFNDLPFDKSKRLVINYITSHGDTFYVVTNQGIARSQNVVAGWIKLTPDNAIPDLEFKSIEALSYSSNLYLLSGSSLYTSADIGKTWSVNTTSSNKLDYITGFSHGKYLFAIDASATNSGEFYQSIDKGISWRATPGITGVYHFNEGYKDFFETSQYNVFCASSPVNAPGIANQRLYRSINQGNDWIKAGDEQCNVIKARLQEVAYGSTGFNLSTNEGFSFRRFPIPDGYVLGGIELQESGYYYIMCYNTASGTAKIFRSRK